MVNVHILYAFKTFLWVQQQTRGGICVEESITMTEQCQFMYSTRQFFKAHAAK